MQENKSFLEINLHTSAIKFQIVVGIVIAFVPCAVAATRITIINLHICFTKNKEQIRL